MDSDIGNIRAVREWSRRYFYTKQDIEFFVTKLNSGLKAYALMIIGPRNKKVTINPGNYEFTLNSDGWYRYLFFFENNSEITLAVEDGDTITYQLNEYNDTINLSPWIIATPLMNNRCRPSGYITTSSTNSGLVAPFDRDENTRHEDRGGIENRWITYEFIEPVTIYKAEIVTPPHSEGNGDPYDFAIQGSNDNSHWDELSHVVLPDNSPIKTEIYIDDPKEYLYYRFFVYYAHRSGSYWRWYINEIIYYTIDQSTTNYQLATPHMTSETQPYGIVSASDYDSYHPPYYAFNGVLNNGWYSGIQTSTHPQWIQYQFTDRPHCIKRIRIYNYGNQAAAPLNFVFQASNDGINYIDLKNCTMRHNDNYYNQYINIDNSMSYTYYRIYVDYDMHQGYVGFDEIELFEEV